MFLVLWIEGDGNSYHAQLKMTWEEAVKVVNTYCMRPSYDGTWYILHGLVGEKKKGKLVAKCHLIWSQGVRQIQWRTRSNKRIPDILTHIPKIETPKCPLVDLAYKILQKDPIALDAARDILKV